MTTLWQDLRYGARMLVKKPGFSLIAVVTLALGIGATTAIFSVVDALLLRPIPFKDSDRLVTMWNHYPGLNIAQDWLSPGEYIDIKTQGESFEEVAISAGRSYNLTGGDTPQRIEGAMVSSSLFSLLKLTPAQGRVFLPEDDQEEKPVTVIVSHQLWAERFGSDPDLIGKPITLNGRTATVVGIMPASFSLSKEVMPTVAGIERADAILPLKFDEEDLRDHSSDNYNVWARLKPGVTVAQAQAELDTIVGRLQQQYPGNYPANSGFRISVTPLLEQVVGNIRLALLVLLGAVAFVLLIACANVANLLIARAAARQKEFAVRTALGAGRRRLIRQLLTESLLLAIIGGGLGLLIAVWGLEALRALGPGNLPRLAEIGINNQVLAFTFIISLLTGVIFGLAPALKFSRIDLNETLKESGRSSTGGSRGRRIRNTLVVSEIALSLVLLVGAGLLIRSFLGLQRVDPGFSAQDVLSLRLALEGSRYASNDSRSALYRQLWERLEKLPGVESVGGASILPLSPGMSWGGIWVEGHAPAPGETDIQSDQRTASHNYFQTMQIPLLRGRWFNDHDSREAQRVAIIDAGFARRFWPDEDPLGKRLKRGGPDSKAPWMTVVGVVGQVKQYTLEGDPPRIAFYTPHSQDPGRSMYVVIRASPNQANMISTVTSEIRTTDPDLPVFGVTSMEERMADSLARQRFSMFLLGLFAALALTLAAVGIYGVMAYVVSQRTHEIGIRVALGAERRDVFKLIVGQGLLLALAGVMIGLAAAFCVTRLMEGLLYGVSATDPLTYALIAVLLTGVALAACYIPARRAMKVDPMIALRCE
jgi:putative ABC transport system permease protein